MINKKQIFLILTIITLLFSGCSSQKAEVKDVEQNKDTLYQISTLNALMEGNFQGTEEIASLKEKGDFGIGTFHSLDGELVMSEGKVYQVNYQGKVTEMDDNITVPFAAVTWFDKDSTENLSGVSNYAELTKALDEMRSSNELFYAYKIDGKFSYIKTRSVPPQEQPYPLLSEVTKNQPIFEYENVEGSLIGFWCPDYVGQVNVPGYHLHFLSADKTMGGHLIEVTMEEGTAFADLTGEFEMQLPETIISSDLADPEKEIAKVEK